MSEKLKVIFAGTPEFASICLQALIDNSDKLNIDIVAVYSQPDRKAGRGQKLTASTVKQLAVKHNIPVEQPVTFRKSSDEGIQARATLASYNPDVMVVVAYGLILPIGVLNTPRFGCLNVHGSLLPRWRGAAPIHRAILAGDTITGVTIMQMDKGLDTGDMLYKVECPISKNDSTATLHDKLAEIGATAICDVLANLSEYQAKAEKQDDKFATYAEKLSKQEGQINWQNSANDIARQIRGMHSYPSTFTFYQKKRVKIIEGESRKTEHCSVHSQSAEKVGTVINIDKKSIAVLCGDNSILQLSKLQFAGGKPLTAEQIFTGKKLAVGDVFS
ncbi:MAG: methionyl-tRNA formyltransferase [Moraxellaceae bacterium]|nr:methionyl-tRNA formyltransferase [Moraxellaceae bacterium]